MIFRQARPLRHYLALLVVALLLPLLALASAILWQYSSNELETIERGALDRARGIASDVEHEITGLRATLQTLATSPFLLNQDWEAFHDQASATGNLINAPVVVVDESGQLLVNTRLRRGEPLPRSSNMELLRLVLNSPKPVISDLVVGTVAGYPVVSVGMGVTAKGGQRLALYLSISTQRFERLMVDTTGDDRWINALSDSNNAIIARSVDTANFVGQKQSKDIVERSIGSEGVHRAVNLQGKGVLRAFRRTQDGWMVASFMWAETADAPIRRNWMRFAFLVVAIFSAALAAAFAFARWVAKPIQSVAAASRTLGDIGVITLPRSQILEANELSESLETSARSLEKRTRALEESEARFRATFDQAAVGVGHLDVEGRWLGVNDKLCAILGYSREECLTRNFQIATHPDDIQAEMDVLNRLMAGSIDNYVFEKRLIRKDKSEAWVRATTSLARGPAGNPLHRISVLEDITEERTARSAQANLAAIVQASPDVIFGESVNGIINTWNPAAERIFGYRAEEIIGQKSEILVPPGLRMEASEAAALVIGFKTHSFETVRVHKDGTEIDVSVSLAPIHDRSGKVIALAVTMKDIRDRKLWEHQIALLNRELAHRVKNSLAVVQSLANQTLRTSTDPAQFSAAFRGRLQALAAANDLLMHSNWTGSDFAAFIDRQLGVLITEPEKQLRKIGPPVVVPASMTVPLGLALHELGTNAIKYGALSTSKGVVEVSWSVAERDGKRRLVIKWRETGGPVVAKSDVRGFGSVLIERGVPGAVVTRDFDEQGFSCVLDVPLLDQQDMAA